jgi:hypothetical protein
MSGKGSKARPFSVPKEVYDKNFEAIFGKKDKPAQEKPVDKKPRNK